jgi:hypothetical protein
MWREAKVPTPQSVSYSAKRGINLKGSQDCIRVKELLTSSLLALAGAGAEAEHEFGSGVFG